MDVNRRNIEKIFSVLKTKTNNKSNIVMKRYYKWLLAEAKLDNPNMAKCISELFDYPSNKPGKIYVWPDNIVNLHKFITGQTYIFEYYYPDPKRPNELLWRKQLYCDRHYNVTKIARNQRYEWASEHIPGDKLEVLLQL